jgi:hypothetical protein
MTTGERVHGERVERGGNGVERDRRHLLDADFRSAGNHSLSLPLPGGSKSAQKPTARPE